MGVLLGLGGGIAMLATGDGSSETTGTEGPVIARPKSRRSLAGGEATEGPCSFASGARMAYDVTTQTHTTIDMSPLLEEVSVGDPGVEAKATAIDQQGLRRWHVDLEAMARGSDGSTVMAARIEAQPMEIPGRGSQPPLAELEETFLVRVDSRCSIREFGWRTEGELAAARDQQQLLAGLAYLAPGEGERSYAGTLFDAVGRYHAAFGVDDQGRLTGRAVDYPEPFGQGSGFARPTFGVESSTIEVEPGAGEWFASLSHTRALTMSLQGREIGQVRGSVVAQRAEPRSWRPTVALDDGGWSWGILLGQPVASSTTEAQQDSALAGVAVQDAVSQYLALVHEGHSSSRTVAYLREWLQANPEGAGELVAMLRAGAFEGEQSGSAGLFLALGTADTPQAGDALLDILQGADDSMAHKISAAHALSKVTTPTEAMVDAVVAAAERTDIHPTERGSLAMTLGTFANYNAERAPELAARARTQIEGWLAQPADDRELAGSLLAAGNTGHDDLAGAIEPYLGHEDPQIRQRAAHAMRHMSPEQAYPRLASSMGDEDATVRASAIETMTQVSRARDTAPPVDVVDVAIDRLDLQTPEREQKALLGLLGEAARRGNEGAHAVLEQHLDDELHSGTRDRDKLRALGRHTRTRWTAE